MVEGRVVDSNMDNFSSFSGNLFAVYVYYLEVGDVGLGVVVRKDVFAHTDIEFLFLFYIQ